MKYLPLVLQKAAVQEMSPRFSPRDRNVCTDFERRTGFIDVFFSLWLQEKLYA